MVIQTSDKPIRHTMTHTVKKRFHCAICKKSFRDNYGLNRHFTMHTRQRALKCDVCNEPFLLDDDLLQYYRSYCGDKPLTQNEEVTHCPKHFQEILLREGHLNGKFSSNQHPEYIESMEYTEENNSSLTSIMIHEQSFNSNLGSENSLEVVESDIDMIDPLDIIEITSDDTITRDTQMNPTLNNKKKRVTIGDGAYVKVIPHIDKRNMNHQEIMNFVSEVSSELLRYRLEHNLTLFQMFEELKAFVSEQEATSGITIGQLESEDFILFLKISEGNFHSFEEHTLFNLMDSKLWYVIKTFWSTKIESQTNSGEDLKKLSSDATNIPKKETSKLKKCQNSRLKSASNSSKHSTIDVVRKKDSKSHRTIEETHSNNTRGASIEALDNGNPSLDQSEVLEAKSYHAEEKTPDHLLSQNGGQSPTKKSVSKTTNYSSAGHSFNKDPAAKRSVRQKSAKNKNVRPNGKDSSNQVQSSTNQVQALPDDESICYPHSEMMNERVAFQLRSQVAVRIRKFKLPPRLIQLLRRNH